jgi:hypothetical protein
LSETRSARNRIRAAIRKEVRRMAHSSYSDRQGILHKNTFEL